MYMILNKKQRNKNETSTKTTLLETKAAISLCSQLTIRSIEYFILPKHVPIPLKM